MIKFPIERQIPAAFAIAIIFLIALGVFAYTNLTALNSAINWELHTQQVLQKLDQTLVKLADAETQSRGFVITGDEQILESYDPTGQPIFDDLAELRRLTADNPQQTERLANIEQLSRDKISILNRIIDARRRNDQTEIAAAIKLREGRNAMTKIRILLGEMKSLETALLRDREDVQQSNFKRAVYISIGGSAVGIFILMLANLAIIRQVKLRRRAEDDLKLNNKELEVRVDHRTRELAETNQNLKTQIEKREEAELLNRATLDSLASHIAVVNKEGIIVTVNNAWDEFSRQNNPASIEQLNYVGVNYLNICAVSELDPVQSAIYENLRKILSGELKFYAVEYPCHSPTAKRWFLLNINALQSDGGGAVISHTNITDRVIAETEREKLLALEKKARLEAEAANRVRDEFLATVSHELRNPLNAILGWSKLLQKNQLDPNASGRAVDAVVRNAESQNHLIEDLLDVSRIIAGKMRLDIAPLSPLNFVQAAVETVRPAAEAKEINLEINIDPRVGKINGDYNRLQQVIWNLLSNAIKFTAKNGKVKIDVGGAASMVEIKISDDGIGIAPEFLPNVFERFRQADASTVRKFGGLGLGLAIVRHIVEMHGGTVEVFSEGENSGSQFVVKLPVNAVSIRNEQIASPADLKFSAEQDEQAADLSGLSILTVDDEPDTCRLLAEILTYHGARVTTAASASDAFAAFQNDHFDVIVSDIGMPEEDGYSLLKKIRSLPNNHGKAIKAIALTAFTRDSDRNQTYDAGFQTHVSKPVEPFELIKIVADLTGRNAA